MATTDQLAVFTALDNIAHGWQYVVFTSGSTQPSLGDTIWGDTSNANAVLEYLGHVSGTGGGGNEVGYMLLSNHNGTAWTSGENFTANTTTAGNHGTLTATPVNCVATPDEANSGPVLDFDASVNEIAMFSAVMPANYGGGGLTCNLAITSTTATGDMSWAMFMKSITKEVDNINAVGEDPSALKVFAAPNFNTAFDAAASAGDEAQETTGFTNGADMDSIAVNERFSVLLMRDAQDGTNDDMAADAQFEFLEIRET